jgi:hypothetical protein
VGQFLWVEEANPELRLLVPFVSFLLSRDPAFRWQPEADAIRHADYRRRALDRIAALGPVHVPVADRYISSDLPAEAAKKTPRRSAPAGPDAPPSPYRPCPT